MRTRGTCSGRGHTAAQGQLHVSTSSLSASQPAILLAASRSARRAATRGRLACPRVKRTHAMQRAQRRGVREMGRCAEQGALETHCDQCARLTSHKCRSTCSCARISALVSHISALSTRTIEMASTAESSNFDGRPRVRVKAAAQHRASDSVNTVPSARPAGSRGATPASANASELCRPILSTTRSTEAQFDNAMSTLMATMLGTERKLSSKQAGR